MELTHGQKATLMLELYGFVVPSPFFLETPEEIWQEKKGILAPLALLGNGPPPSLL